MSGALESGSIKFGEWKNRTTVYQSRNGQINQSLTQPQDINYLNTIVQSQ